MENCISLVHPRVGRTSAHLTGTAGND
jgi:hypothetical protein